MEGLHTPLSSDQIRAKREAREKFLANNSIKTSKPGFISKLKTNTSSYNSQHNELKTDSEKEREQRRKDLRRDKMRKVWDGFKNPNSPYRGLGVLAPTLVDKINKNYSDSLEYKEDQLDCMDPLMESFLISKGLTPELDIYKQVKLEGRLPDGDYKLAVEKIIYTLGDGGMDETEPSIEDKVYSSWIKLTKYHK